MDENKKKLLAIIILVCVAGLIAGAVYQWNKNKAEKAKIIYPDDLQQTETIQKKLTIDKDNAENLKEKIQTAQPNVTYYISSPSIESAAEETAKKINAGDESLPKIATEKTDRTVVTPDTSKQKVDVYKINLNKAHKLKAGIMTTGDKTYYGVGYQQGKWEGMVYTRSGKKPEAVSITYTLKEW